MAKERRSIDKLVPSPPVTKLGTQTAVWHGMKDENAYLRFWNYHSAHHRHSIPFIENGIHLSIDDILICAESEDQLGAATHWLQRYGHDKPNKYANLYAVIGAGYILRPIYIRSLGFNKSILAGGYKVLMENTYYKSDKWRALSIRVKARDNYKCRLCSSTLTLQVHHITYERFGNEELNDLTTLCSRCHKATHKHVLPPDWRKS